jgi:hypothetical protein
LVVTFSKQFDSATVCNYGNFMAAQLACDKLLEKRPGKNDIGFRIF